jgi:Ca2+-binding RTX toxin-like protein
MFLITEGRTIMLLLLLVLATAAMPLATLTVSVFAETIHGTPGDDILNGTFESDIINAFEGNDKLFGEGADDILDGGNGNDEIYGGDGNDEIKDVNDILYSEDKIYGGSDNDNINVGIDYTLSSFYYIYGEAGSDHIKVVSSSAIINGGDNDDEIYCTGYECTVNGDEGDDEIHLQLYDIGSAVHGGRGNDKVLGKAYTVYGDEGNDYLSLDSALDLKGGNGDDILEVLEPSWETYYNGGTGADTFNCSPGLGDIVEDYNPIEGDRVSADCEIV